MKLIAYGLTILRRQSCGTFATVQAWRNGSLVPEEGILIRGGSTS